jgi:hypothetical protein
MLKKHSQLERELARAKLAADCTSLGQISYERHGTSFAEVWLDGKSIKDIALKQVFPTSVRCLCSQQSISETKESIEKSKKEITKRIGKKRAGNSSCTEV